MPETRDPFPFPRYENDDDFRGQKKDTQVPQYLKPTHLAQQQDPWNRLSAAVTVASANKGIFLYNPKAPKDSLDLHLSSVYNHSGDFLKHKNEVLLQKITCDPQRGCWLGMDDQLPEDIFRRKMAKDSVQKDICGCAPEEPDTRANYLCERPPPKQWMSPEKLPIHSIRGTIRSQHTAATNRGYSRKFDGGFYMN
ncbi:cilia- and flagella-associated protein 276 [Hemiscyllium ocellatum]|uniref:cilia- and flagella-associated protein 276 n=1 Tax=Hemiscyllium ocellatum TaxID=170820 RepID=UPI0029663820|nr:cilia- and flagella-associated protein 276 [Hemiscyllium ocellatum]